MILSNFLERAPSFLLSRLLLTMDFESSRRFLQTFRRLRWTTETISQESYRITLKTDGLLDNPLCPLNTFSKYHLLLSRRAAWASFLPDYIDLRHLPWMPNSSLRRFSCSPTMFICFGNKEQRLTSFGVMGIQMPYLLPNARTSLSARRRFRHTMFIDGPERLNDMIIGIGASIEEYDLVIFARMWVLRCHCSGALFDVLICCWPRIGLSQKMIQNIAYLSNSVQTSLTRLTTLRERVIYHCSERKYRGAPGNRNRA